MRLKSEKVDNLEVVKRSANIGKSDFCNLAHRQINSRADKRNYPNTTTSILDLQQLHTTILNGNPNRSCSSIQTILKKLL